MILEFTTDQYVTRARNVAVTQYASIKSSHYSKLVLILPLVVRLFIDTQNKLVALHSAPIRTHEETDFSPRSEIYRLGSVDKAVFYKRSVLLLGVLVGLITGTPSIY